MTLIHRWTRGLNAALIVILLINALPQTLLAAPLPSTYGRNPQQGGSGITRIEANAAAFSYAGSWESYSVSRASAGHVQRSRSLGATANLTFDGTWVRVGLWGHTYGGKAELFIDDVSQGVVDTYRRINTPVTLAYTGLTSTTHTLQVKVLDQRSSFSSNDWVYVDYVDVWDGSAMTTGTFEQNATDRVWLSAGWDTFPHSAASGGSYIREDGATVWFPFTGDSVTYQALAYSGAGQARVFIDDELRGTFDLDSSTTVTRTFSFDNLGSGPHVLHVEPYRGHATVDAFIVPGVAPFYTPPSPAGIVRYEEDAPELLYNGVPFTQTATSWSESSSDYDASDGYYIRSRERDDTVSMTFDGTWVRVGLVGQTDRGKAEIFIDGVSQGVVDTYRHSRMSIPLTYAGLVSTTHTLEIKVLDQRSSFSSNDYVYVDYVDVWDGTAMPMGTFEEDAADRVWRSTGWVTSADSAASGGSYIREDIAIAWFPFTGDSVTYQALAYDGAGQARVFIDGDLRGTFDLDNSTTVTRTFSFNNLGSGPHVLHVEPYRGHATVDAFIVPGVAPFYTPPSPAGIVRYEEDAPELRYNSVPYTQTATSWAAYEPNWASEEYCAGSKTLNDTVSLNFTGTWVRVGWVTEQNAGKAEVWVDGVSLGVVDTYSSTDGILTMDYTGLASGVHTMTVTVLDQRNAASSDDYVFLDYVETEVSNTSLVADFAATPQQGLAPLTVIFSDTSSSGVESWLWDFGDSITSTVANPVHIYSNSGNYTVTLTVTGTGGTDTLIRNNYISVYTELYVNDDGDCAGYSPCYITLQEAVDAASSGGEIYVAQGTYTGTGNSVVEIVGDQGINLRGGWHDDFGERDVETYPSIIEGEHTRRGIYIAQNKPVLIEGFHILNGQGDFGGGIHVAFPSETAAPVVIEDNILAYNTASDDGGGIYVQALMTSTWGTAMLQNNHIFSNTAGSAGGGIHAKNTENITIEDNALANNAAVSGGGIYIPGGDLVEIENNVISANQAGGTGYGGGIFVGSTASPSMIQNNIIVDNDGYEGGGIYIDTSDGDPLTIQHNVVAFHSDIYQGGGIYSRDSVSLSIQNNTIVYNDATRGGGICSIDDDLLTVQNNVITNGAADYGGGMYSDGADFPTIQHNTMVYNGADYGGAGIYSQYANSLTLQNNIVAFSPFTATPGVELPSSNDGGQVYVFLDGGRCSDYMDLSTMTVLSDQLSALVDVVPYGEWFRHSLSLNNGPSVSAELAPEYIICPTGQQTVTLTYNMSGNGSGGYYIVLEEFIRSDTFPAQLDSSWKSIGAGVSGCKQASNGISGTLEHYFPPDNIPWGFVLSNAVSSHEQFCDADTTVNVTTNFYVGTLLTDTYRAAAIEVVTSTIRSMDYNNVWNNAGGHYANGTLGFHDVPADPGFVDAGNGDYHLSGDSPCIDVGDPDTTLDIDFEGDPRPQEDGYDIGVDETGLPSQVPVANFMANVTSGISSLVVTFTNQSTGATSYLWSFGDGTSSTDANPVHNYTQPGVYSVILLATGSTGSDTRIRVDYITVTELPPLADFTATEPLFGFAPLVITFTSSISGVVDSYLWDFGDGASSTAADPIHSYSEPGNYTVTLTVTNSGGSDTRMRRDYISVFGDVLYVNDEGDCYGHFPCYATIQEAVDAAFDGATILVAQGTYTGTGTSVVSIGEDIDLIGGWYDDYVLRDVDTYVSLIDGEDMRQGIYIYASGDPPGTEEEVPTPLVDGFHIFNGDGTQGGGIAAMSPTSPTIQNSTLAHNEASYGGGIYIDTPHLAVIRNNKIMSNTAGSEGAGLFFTTSVSGSVTIQRNAIIKNTSNGSGGGIHIDRSLVAEIENNVIASNQVDGGNGGGIVIQDGMDTSTVQHNTIVGNWAHYNNGAGMYSSANFSLTVRNNIIYNNLAYFGYGNGLYVSDPSSTTVDFNNVRVNDYYGVPAGPNDLYADPALVDTSNHNYHLLASSPCIDRGDNTPALNIDFDGNPRPWNTYFDIGADEYVASDVTAEFSANLTSGLLPLTVTFTDQSAGATSYAWYFGDGTVSTDVNPVHTYTQPGVYPVLLVATGQTGSDTRIRPNYITVTAPPPTANFTTTGGRTGSAPLTITFINQSANASTYVWDLGDGTVSTNISPTHTYAEVGTYTVILTATGAGGSDTLTRTDYITVTFPPPVANFTATEPLSGSAPLVVTFTNSTSGVVDSYLWNFGDGETSTEVHPVHSYNQVGVYNVTLTATGPGGFDTLTRTNYITVTESLNVMADFTANPTSGSVPLTVTFTNTSTGATTYVWNLGDGTVLTDPDPTHTYTEIGTYTVTLTATGPGGSDTLTRTNYITVTFPPPVANFTATEPLSGSTPLVITFTGNISGVVDSYLWNFGDGETSTETQPVHIYNQAGIYTVTLAVTGPGGSDTLTRTNYITVTESPNVVADFTANPISGSFPLTVTFENQSNNAASYLWDFGDGTTSSDDNINLVHTYNQVGVYTVVLTATGSGGSDTFTRTNYINVTPQPPVANFTATEPLTGHAPLVVTFTNSTSGVVDSYLWNFGDGATSTMTNPVHTYEEPGLYNVGIIAYGPGGADSFIRTNYVTVTIPPLRADFTASPVMGNAALMVVFTNTTTGNADSYEWDFGDEQMGTTQHPAHLYETAGTYTVILTATRGMETHTLTRTDYIVVTDSPVVSFTATPVTGTAPLSVNFTNATSNASSYVWDFGDGNTSTDFSPSHTYQQPGYYTVFLTATGPGGTAVLTRTAYIEVWGTDFAAQSRIGAAPLTVTFTDILNDDGRVTSHEWDFGDGTIATGNDATINHTYTQPGVYTPTLTVVRDSNPAYTYSETKPAFVVAYGAEFSASPQTGLAPLDVTFTDIVSSSATLRQWDFGDGTTSPLYTGIDGMTATHTYTTYGTYTPTLTVVRGGYTYSREVTSMIVVAEPACAISTTAVTWWDSRYFQRQPLTLTVSTPLAYSAAVTQVLAVTLDTYTPITNGLMLASGDDLRIVYREADATWRELPRHIEALNTTATTVYFPLQADITDGVTDTYYVYYNHPTPGTPPELYPEIVGGTTFTYTGSGTFTPTVAFTATTYNGWAPLDVTFTNLTSPTTNVNYTWIFGDGGTSTVENPTYTYNTPGSDAAGGAYTVTLRVQTTEGLVITRTEIALIQVPGQAATANLTAELGDVEHPQGVAMICPSSSPQSFQSADGRLTVTFPPGAVTANTLITHTPKVMPYAERSTLAYYDMSATRVDDGSSVTNFNGKEIVFEMRYDDVVIEPVWLEHTLAAFTWDGTKWEHQPTSLDAARDIVQYRVTHFSDQAIAVTGAGTSGGVQSESDDSAVASAVNAAQSDLFSGAATWSYPLHVPPGVNGLQPSLSINYNSHLVEAEQTTFQRSGWLGLGFGLDVGYIDIEMGHYPAYADLTEDGCHGIQSDFDAYLVLNGARSKLVHTSTWFPHQTTDPNLVAEFRLQTENFLRVELRQLGDTGATPWATALDIYDEYRETTHHLRNLYWLVTTKEGTEYRFGFTPESVKVDLLAVGFAPGMACDEPYMINMVNNISWASYPGRAYVDRVEDVYGNQMSFYYESSPPEIAKLYNAYAEGVPENIYNTYSRLKWIHYGPGRSITFDYATDRKDKPEQAEEQRVLASQSARLYPTLLSTVTVQVHSAPILKYTFHYKDIPFRYFWRDNQFYKTEEHPVLTSIRLQDGDQHPFEAETTFAYYENPKILDEHDKRGLLKQIHNGYGVTKTYSYQVFGSVKRVTQIKTEVPGMPPVYQRFHKRFNWPWGRKEREVWTWYESDDGYLLDGPVTRYVFHTPKDSTPFDDSISPIQGRLAQTAVFTQPQNLLWQLVSVYGYVPQVTGDTVPYQSTCYEYKSEWFEETAQNVFVAPQWVNVTYNGFCSGDQGQLRTSYEYDETYGNLKSITEYGAPNTYDDDRRIETTFIMYSNRRVQTRPEMQTVYGRGTDGVFRAEAQTTYHYDFQSGNTSALTQVETIQDGVTTHAYYSPKGNVIATQDGNGNFTIIAYDEGIFPVYTRFANGLVSQAYYDPKWGALEWEQGFHDEAERTNYDYDSFGRLTDVTGPGVRTHYDYHKITDGNGGYQVLVTEGYLTTDALATTQTYNGLGQLIQTRSPGDVLVDYVYDALGRNHETSLPHFAEEAALWTITKYDALGRVAQVTQPDNTKQTFKYFDWQKVRVYDAENNVTAYTQDGRGRTIAVVQGPIQTPTGLQTVGATYQYNALDQLTHITDTATPGNVVTMTYDALGQVISQGDPDMGVWHYRYDAAGNLIKQMDARGEVYCFYYDELNRSLGRRYLSNINLLIDALDLDDVECGPVPDDMDVTYTYDDISDGNYGLGRRTGMRDESGSTTWTYDVVGRVLTESKEIHHLGSTPVYTPVYATAFSYDNRSRLKTLTYPDGEVVTYTYNTAGQLVELASSYGDTYLNGATYNALGQPTVLSLGTSGLSINYDYYTGAEVGMMGQPAYALQSIQAGSLLNLQSYSYDPNGNLSALTGGSIGTSAVSDLNYNYNTLNWLDDAQGTINSEYQTWDYDYDVLGNLIAKDELDFDYGTYLSAPQPVHAPGVVTVTEESIVNNFGYDANGNRVVREVISGSETITYTYSYDAINHLTGVTSKTVDAEQNLVSFVYDGDGNRVEAQLPQNDSAIYVNGYYEIAPWSENIAIYGENGNNQYNPNLVSGVDGTLYMVWVEEGTHCVINFAMRDSKTKTWSLPEEIAQFACPLLLDKPRVVVTVDSASNVMVAWEAEEVDEDQFGYSDIYACYRQASDGNWDPPVPIATGIEIHETLPALTVAGDDTIYLAWQNDLHYDGTLSNTKVLVKAFSNATWTSPIYQSEIGTGKPALAADAEGDVYLVYVKYDNYSNNDFWLVQQHQGTWLTPVAVPSELGIGATYRHTPQTLLINDEGDLMIVRSTADSVYAMRWIDNMMWGPEEDLGGQLLDDEQFDAVLGNNDNPYWIVVAGTTEVNETDILDDGIAGQAPGIAIGPDATVVAVFQGNHSGNVNDRLYISTKTPIKHYYAGGQRIATRTDGQVYYFVGDHLGSTTVVADSDGNEVGHVIYDPFGGVVTSTLPLTVTNRLFTGQRWDATIDLYDYNARFYDPQLGQFTQPDSLVPEAGNPIAWNRYAYVYNNPVNYTDSTGHFIDTLWDAIDLVGDAASCLGGDGVSCFMLPLDVLALALPGVPGAADDMVQVAVRYKDDIGRLRYVDNPEDVIRLVDRSYIFGEMADDEIRFLHQLSQENDAFFIINGSRAETIIGRRNRDLALDLRFEKRMSAADVYNRTGVPIWRNKPPTGQLELDYFTLPGQGGLSSTIRRKLHSHYDILDRPIELDNWVKFRKAYGQQPPGGIVFDRGRIYRN